MPCLLCSLRNLLLARGVCSLSERTLKKELPFSPFFIYLNWLSLLECWKKWSLQLAWHKGTNLTILNLNLAEIGVQISSDCVVRPLHMLFYWSIYRNQSAENKAVDRGCLGGSMEKDIPNVICILHKHRVGECQPALHSSLLHADNKIFHSCNNRLANLILSSSVPCVSVSAISDQSLPLWYSDSSVVGLEEILRVAHLGFFDPNSGRDSADFHNRAEL